MIMMMTTKTIDESLAMVTVMVMVQER